LEEAQVKLAQATRKAKFKGSAKSATDFKALQTKLQERVGKGEMTEEEAKAKLVEAKKRAATQKRTSTSTKESK
jgi:hypothetical protein